MKVRALLNAALLAATVADTVGMRRRLAQLRTSGRGPGRQSRAGSALQALHADSPDRPAEPVSTGTDALWLAALAGNVALNRGWGVLTLAAWSAQPAAVFSGDADRPADVTRFSLTRTWHEARGALRTLAAARAGEAGTSQSAIVAELREDYRAELANGTERFFEPRRTDCPWCGSANLRVRLRTTDLMQQKPGEFVLEQCDDCAHTFQNPRLSQDGLNFYYRDFYDGLGAKWWEGPTDVQVPAYLRRARALTPFVEPSTWLDVGTGHAHFCATAREVFPNTTFDGIDIGAGVEVALREGTLRKAYRGDFASTVNELAGEYDVVSMFHYLEHTIDPLPELLGARTALRDGGYLIIDVPDPECRLVPVLGRWWSQWLQPQHLHLAPLRNLSARLTELGFTVLAEERAGAHVGVDLVAAVWSRLNELAPRADLPWLPEPPTPRQRLLRALTLASGSPVVLLAMLVDLAIRPFAEPLGVSNAFRVVARLDHRPGAA